MQVFYFGELADFHNRILPDISAKPTHARLKKNGGCLFI